MTLLLTLYLFSLLLIPRKKKRLHIEATTALILYFMLPWAFVTIHPDTISVSVYKRTVQKSINQTQKTLHFIMRPWQIQWTL